MTLRMTAKALVKQTEPKIRQQCGWPSQAPRAVPPRQVERQVVLVIEEKPEIVSLFRYTPEGRCIGNSWHRTVDGARQQAGIEFNDLFLDWNIVPSEVQDVVSYALKVPDEEG